VADLIEEWWGGRPTAATLPKLFFVHFRETTFVVEDGDELLGFLSALASQTYLDEVYCQAVAVHPEHRRKGLGRALYERLFEVAREHGRPVVSCVVEPADQGVTAFHRELGFEVVGELADHEGVGKPRVLLRKRL
jgi:ribosomal protein S18 acetylase RimI-like enzyme